MTATTRRHCDSPQRRTATVRFEAKRQSGTARRKARQRSAASSAAGQRCSLHRTDDCVQKQGIGRRRCPVGARAVAVQAKIYIVVVVVGKQSQQVRPVARRRRRCYCWLTTAFAGPDRPRPDPFFLSFALQDQKAVMGLRHNS